MSLQTGRFSRCMENFSAQQMDAIRQKRVCVVGCGSLGGHVAQSLARFGVGSLTLIDGEEFSPGNLHGQVFATADTLGQNKALATRAQLMRVNGEVALQAHCLMLTAENAGELLLGHHLVVDCLDNIPARFLLQSGCEVLGIPLVHGAVSGFYGQVANIFPRERLLNLLYPGGEQSNCSAGQTVASPAFAPQAVAAFQCSEALKILAGRAEILRGAVLHVDLLRNLFVTEGLL